MHLIQLLCIVFTFYILVAAIIGHLSFFLYQQSPKEQNSLEQAAQIYQQSNYDSAFKQAVENLFEAVMSIMES
jgi:hypothetical protein